MKTDANNQGGCKVLLIEDDKPDQMAFLRMAEKQETPYDCAVADSVSQAREVLQKNSFDIVILDYNLGDGTAFDVLDFLKDIPVIVVTGVGGEEIAVKAWKAGACDYIIKDGERNYLKILPVTIENAIKHKKTQEKVHQLSQAVVSTKDSIHITDMQDKIIFVNSAFCTTYGFTAQEIIGEKSSILWGRDRSSEAEMEHIADGWEAGFYHARKDGSKFPVSITRSDITNENGEVFAVVVVTGDISEKMRTENDLRKKNTKLERQNAENRELFTEGCYQLTCLAGSLEKAIVIAKKNVDSGDSLQLKHNIKLADTNIEQINTVVGSLLATGVIDSNKHGCDKDVLYELIGRIAKMSESFISSEEDVNINSDKIKVRE